MCRVAFRAPGAGSNQRSAPAILVVDDDPSILKVIRLQLQDDGFRVVTARSGREALLRFEEERPDLAVLDVQLPDITGFDLLRRLHVRDALPVILVTGFATSTTSMLRGLEMGADDYLLKPLNPDELSARVRAILRRQPRRHEITRACLQVGPLTIDFDRHVVTRHGRPVRLTSSEWRLLEELVRELGRPLLKHQALRTLWGPDHLDDVDRLRTLVSRLRSKLDPERPTGGVIRTHRGVGYVFQVDPVEAPLTVA